MVRVLDQISRLLLDSMVHTSHQLLQIPTVGSAIYLRSQRDTTVAITMLQQVMVKQQTVLPSL